jgi:hypothetical protein
MSQLIAYVLRFPIGIRFHHLQSEIEIRSAPRARELTLTMAAIAYEAYLDGAQCAR